MIISTIKAAVNVCLKLRTAQQLPLEPRRGRDWGCMEKEGLRGMEKEWLMVHGEGSPRPFLCTPQPLPLHAPSAHPPCKSRPSPFSSPYILCQIFIWRVQSLVHNSCCALKHWLGYSQQREGFIGEIRTESHKDDWRSHQYTMGFLPNHRVTDCLWDRSISLLPDGYLLVLSFKPLSALTITLAATSYVFHHNMVLHIKQSREAVAEAGVSEFGK